MHIFVLFFKERGGWTFCLELINREAPTNGEGGFFSKFNKRAGSNKEAGWNIFFKSNKGAGEICSL